MVDVLKTTHLAELIADLTFLMSNNRFRQLIFCSTSVTINRTLIKRNTIEEGFEIIE